MIKIYKASGYSLGKLLSEIPENVEKNIISISHEEIPTTYKEYDEEEEEEWEEEMAYITSDTYYKITAFYHE